MVALTHVRSAVRSTRWRGTALDARRRWSTGGSAARLAAPLFVVGWLSLLLDLLMSNALLTLATWLRGRLACLEPDRSFPRHGPDGPEC